jgi:hypothetical protein
MSFLTVFGASPSSVATCEILSNTVYLTLTNLGLGLAPDLSLMFTALYACSDASSTNTAYNFIITIFS